MRRSVAPIFSGQNKSSCRFAPDNNGCRASAAHRRVVRQMSSTYSKPPKTISEKPCISLRGDYSGPMPTRKGVTQKDMEFMSRMDGDIEERRRTKFVNEISALHLRQSVTPTIASQQDCRACLALATPSHLQHLSFATGKHPNFRNNMLEPPKSKFKEVDLNGNGPITRVHDKAKNAWDRGPYGEKYQWGPLGGWY